MSSFSEKRRIVRADLEAPCSLQHEDIIYAVQILNFSLTGFLVSNPFNKENQPQEGTVYITIPGLSMGEIACNIARIDGETLGLQFQSMDYDTLMQLKSMLSELTNDPNLVERQIIGQIEKQP